jgi:two-component system, response regulator PdtaR
LRPLLLQTLTRPSVSYESRNDIRAVFTDVDMPGSMDGLRLARVVRNRWPPVALIVTSGQIDVPENDLPNGGRFLPKPYEAAQIAATLSHLIEGRTSY